MTVKRLSQLYYLNREIEMNKRQLCGLEMRSRGKLDAQAAAEAAVVAAVQQEVTNARVAAATREALMYLGLNPGQHCLVNATVAAASTSSSVFSQMVRPDSPARWQYSRCPASTSTRRPPASPGSAHPT